MSEMDMSAYESQFNEWPGLETLETSFLAAEQTARPEIIDGMEAIEFTDDILKDIARSLEGNTRCIEEQDLMMLRLDPDFDSAALRKHLPGVRQLFAVTGPVSCSNLPELWYRGAIKITDNNGIDTMYEFVRQRAPSISIIGYGPDGQQEYSVPRQLNQNNVSRLADAVKAVEAARE